MSALHLAVDHEIAGRYRARSHVAGAPVGERWRVSDDQGPDGLLTLLTPPRAGKDPDALRAYLAALRTFGHPHAVPVTDAGVHRDEAFVVTEVPAGVALRAWLGDLKAEGRRVSLRDARAIIEQVIQCLATAHRHDEPLAHGASLAESVTVERRGEVQLVAMVADVGLLALVAQGARALPPGADPERASPHDDVFNVGALLTEMLADVVLDARSELETLGPRLEVARPEVDPSVWRVVTACVARDPAVRLSSMARARDLVRQAVWTPRELRATPELQREAPAPPATSSAPAAPSPAVTRARIVATSSAPAPAPKSAPLPVPAPKSAPLPVPAPALTPPPAPTAAPALGPLLGATPAPAPPAATTTTSEQRAASGVPLSMMLRARIGGARGTPAPGPGAPTPTASAPPVETPSHRSFLSEDPSATDVSVEIPREVLGAEPPPRKTLRAEARASESTSVVVQLPEASPVKPGARTRAGTYLPVGAPDAPATFDALTSPRQSGHSFVEHTASLVAVESTGSFEGLTDPSRADFIEETASEGVTVRPAQRASASPARSRSGTLLVDEHTASASIAPLEPVIEETSTTRPMVVYTGTTNAAPAAVARAPLHPAIARDAFEPGPSTQPDPSASRPPIAGPFDQTFVLATRPKHTAWWIIGAVAGAALLVAFLIAAAR